MIEDLQNTLPLVNMLKDRAIRERHWLQISKICSVRLDPLQPGFKLKNLLDAKLVHFREEVCALVCGCVLLVGGMCVHAFVCVCPRVHVCLPVHMFAFVSVWVSDWVAPSRPTLTHTMVRRPG